MGPIILERTAAPALKKEFTKEKLRTKTSDGPVTSSKKCQVSQNQRPQKQAGSQLKLVSPRQGKGPVPAAERASQHRWTKAKPETPYSIRNGTTLSAKGEMELKLPPPSLTEGGKELEAQLESRRFGEGDRSREGPGRGRGRRPLSLPLAPRELCPVRQVTSLKPVQLGQEEDTDSGSDLSDSERLPVLPSPCTPPQLNLRAEVIDPSDLQPHFPGPRGGSHSGYVYPDFLPPPFCTWSLRQLAVFLNTEGRAAPRPKPVGQLEKYLERLLQLEWLQIQTVQAENGRPGAPGLAGQLRPHCTATSATGAQRRPHTAPPLRLDSPRSLSQCQRAFPLTFMSSLGYTPSAQRSPACPNCHLRYPLCNGTCSCYTYHRHSRLSPVLERRARPGQPPTQKRSSSESRVPAPDRVQSSGGPPAGKHHLKRMQAAGNIRSPPQGPSPTGRPQGALAAAGSGGSRDPVTVEKGAPCRNGREQNSVRKSGREKQRAGVGRRDSKPDTADAVPRHSSISKGLPRARSNGNPKHI